MTARRPWLAAPLAVGLPTLMAQVKDTDDTIMVDVIVAPLGFAVRPGRHRATRVPKPSPGLAGHRRKVEICDFQSFCLTLQRHGPTTKKKS